MSKFVLENENMPAWSVSILFLGVCCDVFSSVTDGMGQIKME